LAEQECKICQSDRRGELAETFIFGDLPTKDVLALFPEYSEIEMLDHFRHEMRESFDLNEPGGRRMAMLMLLKDDLKKKIRSRKDLPAKTMAELLFHLDRIDLDFDSKRAPKIGIWVQNVDPLHLDEVHKNILKMMNEMESRAIKALPGKHRMPLDSEAIIEAESLEDEPESESEREDET